MLVNFRLPEGLGQTLLCIVTVYLQMHWDFTLSAGWSFNHWRDLIDQILHTVPGKPEPLHQLHIRHVIHGIVSVSENSFSSHSASTE
jgi:hypothetical protein